MLSLIRMREKGFAPLILLILIPFIIAFFYVSIKRGSIKIGNPLLTSTPLATIVPTATPTMSSSPTPIPTIPPTLVSTIKPTLAPVSGPPGSGLSTINVHTDKGDFIATVMSFDLANTRVITDTANDSDCSSNCSVTSLQDFVNKNGGFAGVNGTYFCPAEPAYASCGQNNSFDFTFYNTRLGKWINQGNLGYAGRSIVYFDGSGAHYTQNASGFGGGLNAGIVMSPGLVDNGNVQIDDSQSGLSDKQKAVSFKLGIGLIGTNKVMIVGANAVTMQQFAYVFKALSATSAMNLDEGGSTAMFYQGRYIFGPGRNIPNAIVFASK